MVVAALLLPTATSADSPRGRICTQIGCVSGITVKLPAPTELPSRAARVTVCMDDRCRAVRVARSRDVAQSVWIEDRSLSAPTRVRVRVVVRGAHGRTLSRAERDIALSRTQPNGPDCPPTCWSAALRVDARISIRLET